MLSSRSPPSLLLLSSHLLVTALSRLLRLGNSGAMLKHAPRLPVQQLVILSICRFAEPVVLTSVLPYLPEMIESVGVPRNEVGKWVGITQAVTAICQASMAVTWGTLSDSAGRKPIILLGLTCTMIFSLLFGLSRTLPLLVTSRAFLGLMNGNVGIIRTMVAEMVPEKELQPRAFSVMPLVWTIGTIFGPAFGGALARPADKHPGLFGGSAFLKKYPFLLPNFAAAVLFVVGILVGGLFLKETLASRKDRVDYGIVAGQILTRPCTSRRRKTQHEAQDGERQPLLDENRDARAGKKQPSSRKPSWKEVFSPQSNLILVAYALMALHTMAFDTLLPVFLHREPQQIDGNPDVRLPLKFLGGFGVDAQTIGLYYTLIGTFGMVIQFTIFPTAAKRYGALACLKTVSCIFPILYLLTPFSALVPPSLRHVVVFLLMLTKLAASIFGFPCTTILLTNSATSLSVLGSLNGVATSVSAIGRAVGPAVVGATFSLGVKAGYIILPWWLLAGFGVLSAVVVSWIVESEGFMGKSEEDEDDEEEEGEEDEEEEERGDGYGSVNHSRRE